MMTKSKFTEEELQQYSSAFTLSDMEIFIFPDLMYALVLANIMSPQIWEWRKAPWFDKIEKKSFNYRINRVKQYIMDHYVFNLDLDTWGLTTKQTELDRFKNFIDQKALAQSNALFGYEGDKYYFDIDIRRHFGLDKYTTDAIPYWKTETVEAMTAFQYRPGYTTGAGECVSLSALYIAAMFVVGRIPLDKMYLIATPLHSQNFIAEKEGFITNNRRIVTKTMWCNGTELSAKARRAVENEKITIVSHLSGHIHTYYPLATISPEVYDSFKESFNAFLQTDFNFDTFVNFLYSKEAYWSCFQYKHLHNGKDYYTSMTHIFNTQRTSKNRFDSDTRAALLAEMEIQEFSKSRLEKKIVINDFEDYLRENASLTFEEKANYFLEILLIDHCQNIRDLFSEIQHFLHITPRLPQAEDKHFVASTLLPISTDLSREEIMELIQTSAQTQLVPSLALHAYRMMDKISWIPYLKSALERNPVSLEALKENSIVEIYKIILSLSKNSIYDGVRLSQPDEVWNFQRGDGIEKAILLLNILIHKQEGKTAYVLTIQNKEVQLIVDEEKMYVFETQKNIEKKVILDEKGQVIQE
ncbi:MAG: hypothetical protein RRY15_05335 [Bacteroidales bacterium]